MNRQKSVFRPKLAGSLVVALALTACASGGDDPWHTWNHGAQAFNDGLDKHIVKPLAQGYQWITPDVVEQSVNNGFSNVNDIGVIINDFLQLKWRQGSMDVGRLVVNSTMGLGGLFDVGTIMNLPKHKEDFGQTLAVWGVPSGPYLVLPIYGPNSPRDTLGLVGDALFNPLTYISIFGTDEASYSTMGSRFAEVVDKRAQLLSTEKVVNEAAGADRYEFLKNSYKQHRDYLIHDGKTEDSDLDTELDSLDADEKNAKPATTNP